MRNRLVIRADADSWRGTGHVMRCIALGQAWQDGWQRSEDRGQKSESRERPSVIFICATIPNALAERIRSEGFGLIRINAEPGGAQDIQQTLEAVDHQSSDLWMVADGYHFDLDYQRIVRRAGFRLLLIDDYNHLPEYECDILLNQNINAAELDYKINPEARLLLGTDYTMLRREFQGFEKTERIFPNTGKKILVTLGGADPDNVTLKVIDALRQLNVPDLHAKVIVGSANPHIESLRKAVSSTTINCELINSVRDMPGLMHWAELAVSAAGSTCWELCCLGVPFVTVVLAENQRGLAEGLNRRGIASNARIDPQDITALLTRMLDDPAERARMSFAGRDLIDGFGADRVLFHPAKECGLDLFTDRLTLRPAEARDMKLFWRWANDPDARRNSYHPESIPLADHQRWFEKKLKLADSAVFVMELDGVAAGQVRYDRTDGETAEIDFSIDQKFRGLGLGTRIIGLSVDLAVRQLGIRKLRALVIETNRSSCRVFESAGFERQGFDVREGVRSARFEKQWEIILDQKSGKFLRL